MFWNNLTENENVRYRSLTILIKPWVTWASLSKTKRADVVEPYKPSDAELSEVEYLSMKGWGMIDEKQFYILVSALSPKQSTVMEI